MRASGKLRLAAAFVVVASIFGAGVRPAQADVSNSTATNVEAGNNRATASQRGASTSGDANGGQIAGVVANRGRVSVDATNVSKDSSAESGDARGSNTASSLTGLARLGKAPLTVAADITNVNADNIQDGNNTATYSQAITANTGDAVSGQVIGVVANGGTTSVVASNTTDNSDATTGDAHANNAFAALTGLAITSGNTVLVSADITNVTGADNVQEGDNRTTGRQSANASTGDGVAGQVVGVVSAGATSVDATNRSSDVTATTGDSHADNALAQQVGLDCTSTDRVTTVDISNAGVDCQVQQGDNRATGSQNTTGTSGDAVAGEIIGAVTSAGGSNSIVAANSSTTSDATSGDATAFADAAQRVGLSCPNVLIVTSDITNVSRPCDVQEGDNRATTDQTTAATTGDGVAGQVLGSVSAGATSIDARNATADSSATSGDARSSSDAVSAVGDYCSNPETLASDITTIRSCEVQEGSNRATATQSAASKSGDAVSGQVAGAVTSAGGSNSIVLANTTNTTDTTSGDTKAADDATAQSGLSCPGNDVITADITNVTSPCDLQEGNDRTTSAQTASATSGDAVGGQVVGSVSAGATSIDGSNRTDDSSVQTGDGSASNDAVVRAGTFCPSDQTIAASDISGVTSACNVQEGNDTTRAAQNATASTGDGVAGEVIGSVTSAGGSSSIVAANRSTSMDVTTGDADGSNAFVGSAAADCPSDQTVTADITNIGSSPCEIQEGSNRVTGSQTASASTGDGVGGQVIGNVSAGRSSIDANNSSTNSSVDTGDARASNDGIAFASTDCENKQNFAADITNTGGACSIQEGSNRATTTQAASATTGDGVAGEVIGAVTSAGGSTSIVAANGTDNSDVTTGDAHATNDLVAFAGDNCSNSTSFAADITNVGSNDTCNVQEGSNRVTAAQTAAASTGDGVAGQVLGVVSAGATSVDASNRSMNVSAQTGDARAANAGVAFAGLQDSASGPTTLSADITGARAENVQDGNDTESLTQNANASTGDGVAGQVTGVVTSAGGSASVVVANTSNNIDSSTGDSRFDNSQVGFVGLAFVDGRLTLL